MTFIRLGNCLNVPVREEDINVIKRFSVSLCDDDCKCFSIDLARYEILKYQQNMDIPSSPPTGVALTRLSPVSHFYTPGKRQKTKGFSGGIEM